MLDHKCPELSMAPTSVRLCAQRGNPSLQDKHSYFSHTNCIPSVFPMSVSKRLPSVTGHCQASPSAALEIKIKPLSF